MLSAPKKQLLDPIKRLDRMTIFIDDAFHLYLIAAENGRNKRKAPAHAGLQGIT
ncbi:hypothetical protein [Undibacterium sp. Ji22W]|uniref:hypothetical protein n=1 Tax=Undibacterium sp. Ji22W TaxID=3413038 RepID=UPI003BF2DC11